MMRAVTLAAVLGLASFAGCKEAPSKKATPAPQTTPVPEKDESAKTTVPTPTEEPGRARELKPLAAFEGLSGPERSLALFKEVGKVILHPRCVNCHPAGDRPLQRDGALHHPLVVRGETGEGAPGQPCTTCHGDENFRNVPGIPNWHLAPREMAWEGRTLGQICEQITDHERNGGKDLAALAHHMANDALVAYGWNPPPHLESAPGTQAQFSALFQAWVDAGAVCP